jgi:predicted outer membrane repeat protein
MGNNLRFAGPLALSILAFAVSMAAFCPSARAATHFTDPDHCSDTYKVNVAKDVIAADDGSDDCSPEGGCSLRQAVANAASCGIPHVVIYVPAGRYLIDRSPALAYENATDDLDPDHGDIDVALPAGMALEIIGEGIDQTVIDGGYATRLFDVRGQASVKFAKMTLTRGAHAFGGAPSTNVLTNVGDATSAKPADNGGAISIAAGSTVSLSSVALVDNQASALATAPAQAACGGAIASAGTLYADHVQFALNRSSGSGGAICSTGAFSGAANQYQSNSALVSGGAVYVAAAGSHYETNAWYDQNQALSPDGQAGSGGAAYIVGNNTSIFGLRAFVDSRFTANVAISGGAVAARLSAFSFRNDLFQGNSAQAGGALHLSGVAPQAPLGAISASVFRANSALTGGALLNLSAGTTVSSSLFDSNVAQGLGIPSFLRPRGAAIHSAADLLIKASSIVRNSSPGEAAGIYSSARLRLFNDTLYGNVSVSGGAAVQTDGPAQLKNDTIVSNHGSAISVPQILVGQSGSLTMGYTILNGDGANANISVPAMGHFQSRGYNNSNGYGWNYMTPLLSNDMMYKITTLSAIAPAGSPIGPSAAPEPLQVIKPVAGGTAVDRGETFANANDDINLPGCTRADALNALRPVGGHCDIGAIEYVAPVRVIVTSPIGGLKRSP